MRRTALKVIAIVVVVVLLISGGFWAGLSFNVIKRYILNINQNNIATEEDDGKRFFEDISENFKGSFNIEPLEDTLRLINSGAIVKKSEDELIQAAIEGMLSILDDKHAEYFTVEEYDMITQSYNGTMSGIGIIVSQDDDGKVIVVVPIEGAPAIKAGLKEGDIIIGVDGIDIKAEALESVVTMIKGEEGTKVDLEIFRPDEDRTFKVTITRANFYVPNLISDILEEEIGYINYIGFQDKGVEMLDKEIEKLMESGIKGLIFDLRNNLGGVLDDAVAVCDLFMPQGAIVTVRGRSGNEEKVDEYFASKGKYTDIPLIVLINGFSASASELVAGALKDNNRAILVGEQSFGKGTVQVIHDLSNGAGLKFTTAKYFLPSGISIDGVGISPDVLVELGPESTEDLQLERALEEINTLIEKSGNGQVN